MDERKKVRFFLIIFGLINVLTFIPNASAENEFTKTYDKLFLLVTVISAIVGLFVLVLWVYFMVKFREGNDVDRTPISHNTSKKLEIAWTGVAIGIVVLLMIVTYPVLFEFDSNAEGLTADKEVFVKGQTWSWTFTYEGETFNSQNTSSILTLTAGLTYRFTVWSVDVIHGFYIPELNIKIDANPGTNNTLTVQINDPGTYNVWCNEYCGGAHSDMRGTILVTS